MLGRVVILPLTQLDLRGEGRGQGRKAQCAGSAAGKRAIQTLATIVLYAIMLHLFFLGLEVFTVFYSQIPDHMDHSIYLYAGLHGYDAMAPWMWSAVVMGLASIGLLIVPRWRARMPVLAVACCLVFGCTWIDKGLSMISGGYIPTPLHEVYDYIPTWVELAITVGVYALGALILTLLYKMVVGVKHEVRDAQPAF